MQLNSDAQAMINRAKTGDKEAVAGAVMFYKSMAEQAAQNGMTALFNEMKQEFEYWFEKAKSLGLIN